MTEIMLGNTIVRYTLRQSARARVIRLTMNIDKGLVMTIPNHVPIEEVESFIREKQKWILKEIAFFEEQKSKRPERQFEHGEEIEFLGKKIPFHIEKYSGKGVTCKLVENVLQIRISHDIDEKHLKTYIKRVIEVWLRYQARYYIPRRVKELNAQIGFDYRRVTIKNQKSRWGSCSKQKNLNFNFRLMMAPSEIVDYVIIHELMHLRELNHSKNFYSLLKQYCPNYLVHEKWMKEHGVSLVL